MVREVKTKIQIDLQSWDPKQRGRLTAPLMDHSQGEEFHGISGFPPLSPTSHFPHIA